jgi:hypothetical protein
MALFNIAKAHQSRRSADSRRIIRNHHERKGRKAAEKAINAFSTPMGLVRGFIPQVHALTGIPETTLRRWQQKIRDDRAWRPWRPRHGERHRIFTPTQETAIVSFITENFIRPELIFTDEDFRELAITALFENHAESPDPLPPFESSNGFIYAFKHRHHLTSRRIHYKRRPAVTEQQRQRWVSSIRDLMQTIPLSRIVNCDETAWLLHPKGILTWARAGSESVQAKINGDEKDCLTVLASVTAAGDKIPLSFFASGKTTRVEESQIGAVPGHWRDHSESGWQTSETFQTYLGKLRTFMGEGPIHLLLDSYAAHRTNAVKKTATALDITLHYIPPGLTDELQPLDRSVFGALKSRAKHLFHERFRLNPFERRTKIHAVQDMVSAWSHLGEATLVAAWEIYTD